MNINIVEALSMKIHGRSFTLAKAGQGCVSCGGTAREFRDELSRKEYDISGLCQKCQDQIFVDEE